MRRYMRHLFIVSALLSLLLTGFLVSRLAGAPPASAASAAAPRLTTTPNPTPACPPQWTIYPNPAPAGESTLYGITALAANDLWSVGYYTSTGTQQTLTLHGDGTSWTQVPSPNPGSGNAVLRGVAGVAPNDVWAVGSWAGGTLTEHWNGTAWSIVPSPNGGRPQNHLYAVTAVAGNDVWAVGDSTDGTFLSDALIEHWNGTTWTAQIGPPSGSAAVHLYGVAAASATDVWAVGGVYADTLIDHWNGSTWSVVPGPHANGPLTGVTAVAANDVWAVGYYTNNGQYTFTAHWDANVTRGQLAKIDVVAAGWALVNPATGSFADVAPGSAFYEFVETAYCHGIISGYSCGGVGEPCVPPANRPYFRQYNEATRGQIAKIVYLSVTAGGACGAP